MSSKDWDKFYLGLAKYVSSKSKDPSTKVGSVIVRPNRSVASLGFNGFPQKMDDTFSLCNYENREEKYSRIIHAEINALIFCKDQFIQGYSIYVWPLLPCDRCFVQLVQAGITRFVGPKLSPELQTRWGSSIDKVKKYALECSVKVEEIDE